MADDRLPCCRWESITATKSDNVMWRSPPISFRLLQNASSRLTLVLWPPTTTERLVTRDFIKTPPACGKLATSQHKIRALLWPSKRVPECCKNHTKKGAAEQRDELALATFHCPMPPVLPTGSIARLRTAGDCCIHPTSGGTR